MAARDFTSERRVLIRGTRRFIIRRPTCDTIARLTARYALEILALRKTHHEAKGLAGPREMLQIALPIFTADLERLGAVLESCVDIWDAAPGELEAAVAGSRELAEALVLEVLKLSDVPRLCSLLGLDQPMEAADEAQDEAIVEPFDLMLGAVADHFGTDPFRVMGWDFLAVHALLGSVIPQLNALKAGKLPAAAPTASSGPGIEDLAAGGFGIAYHQVPS